MSEEERRVYQTVIEKLRDIYAAERAKRGTHPYNSDPRQSWMLMGREKLAYEALAAIKTMAFAAGISLSEEEP